MQKIDDNVKLFVDEFGNKMQWRLHALDLKSKIKYYKSIINDLIWKGKDILRRNRKMITELNSRAKTIKKQNKEIDNLKLEYQNKISNIEEKHLKEINQLRKVINTQFKLVLKFEHLKSIVGRRVKNTIKKIKKRGLVVKK
jgi:hypothetical protein